MNIFQTVACKDCAELIKTGNIEHGSDGWDVDTALMTIDEYIAKLTGESVSQSNRRCAVCFTNTPGERHGVRLEDDYAGWV